MKFRKRLATLTVIILIFCSFSACRNVPVDDSNINNVYYYDDNGNVSPNFTPQTETTTSESILQATTTPILSASCDKILSYGYDSENNYYELVANETETFSGTSIEIGVIKNNEWAINLTTDSPFIGENGLLSKYNGESNVTGSIYDSEFTDFSYIGDGCFHYNNDIWNGNNGLIYKASENDYYNPVIKSVDNDLDNDGLVVLDGMYGKNYKLLDVNTMTITTTNIISTNAKAVSPYSEGLFACAPKYSNEPQKGFYDKNGEMIIDLSEYEIYSEQLIFINGESTFKIVNDQNHIYEITINKNGDVIDSNKIH